MVLKDAEVFTLIAELGAHFCAHIATPFTERMLSSIQLDAESRNLIIELTERSEGYKSTGYHPDDLYRQIMALARYLFQIRRDVLPNIRTLSPSRASCVDQGDRIRRDLTICNFGPNLNILADFLSALFIKIAALEKEAPGKDHQLYAKYSTELGRCLTT